MNEDFKDVLAIITLEIDTEKDLEKIIKNLLEKGRSIRKIENIFNSAKVKVINFYRNSLRNEVVKKLTRNVVPISAKDIKVGEKYWHIYRDIQIKYDVIYIKIRVASISNKRSPHGDVYTLFNCEILPYEKEYDKVYRTKLKFTADNYIYGNAEPLYKARDHIIFPEDLDDPNVDHKCYRVQPFLPPDLLEEIKHLPGRGIVYQESLESWNKTIEII